MSLDERVESFKQDLLSKGINWNDTQIKNYITLRQAGGNIAKDLSESANAMQPANTNNYSMIDEYFGPSQAGPVVPQEQKSAAYDFLGNFLWEGLDALSFGSLGYADWTDPIEDALSGEQGPETFAGRVGSGLGGFLGFLGPMAATGGTLGAVAAAGKAGAAAKAASATSKGVKFLASEAGVSKKGYKAFQKLSRNDQETFFKPFADDILQVGPKASNPKVREAYTKRFTENLRQELSGKLKEMNIKPTDANLSRLEEIIQKAAGVSANSSLPVATLEARIALALGGAAGAGKIASVAATSFAEALTFAAVETPFEYFQAREEGRDIDMVGRWGHAMALGSVLGLVKYVPGGRSWEDGGIFKTAYKRMKDSMNNKRAYSTYDLSKQEQRDQIVLFAKSLYARTGAKPFRDFMKKKNITTKTDIEILGQDKAGAKQLVEALSFAENQFKLKWAPQFFKEMAEDLTTSSARMLMGSLAFNHELLFEDSIPLEDKIFHTLLGAYMTKKGRVLEYRNTVGGYEKVAITDTKPVGQEFRKSNEFLKLMRMDPQLYNLNATLNASDLMQKHLQGMDLNSDLNEVKAILEKHKAIVKDDGTSPKKKPKKTRGTEGSNPIFDYIRGVYDYVIGSKDQTRALDAERLTLKQIKAIERDLRDFDFAGITRAGGVEKITDIDDIFYAAADNKMKKLLDLHLDAAIAIHNHLAPEGRKVSASTEKNVLTRLYEIVGDAASKDGTLSAKNDLLLDRYRRILHNFGGSLINVDRNAGHRLKVTNEQFKGLAELIDRYEAKINEIIYGESVASSVVTRAGELAQEGFLYELMAGQQLHKSIRNTYDKLNDLPNQRGGWAPVKDRKNENITHDGEVLADLINKLFIDSNGMLYESISFGKNVPAELQTMAQLFWNLKSGDPNSKVPLFEGSGNPSPKITKVKDLRLLRQVLYRNGMKGFLTEHRGDQQIFMDSYQTYANQRFMYSSTRKDGGMVTVQDRKIIGHLMDMGLVGKNYQLVDVLSVLNPIETLISTEGLKVAADGKLRYKSNGREFQLTLDKIKDFEHAETLRDYINQHGNEAGILTSSDLNLLLKSYTELIDPYLKQPDGTGFLKHSQVVTQITPGKLAQIVQRIDTIKQLKDNEIKDNLLETIERLHTDSAFNKRDREKLSYLFHLYKSGTQSTSKIIKALDDAKLFDFNKKEIVLDPHDKLLTEKLNDIIAKVEWDIKANSDINQIENNINTYRNGNESKQTEVELYRNATKESLVTDYNLDKDIDFDNPASKSFDPKQIVESAYIIKGGKKHFYDSKSTLIKDGDGVMNAQQKAKFIGEFIRVLGSTNETRVLERLHATENYGIHTQSEYKVYNNHFFDFLDVMIGKKGGFAVVDFDVQLVKNVVKSARNDSDTMDTLTNLLNNIRLHVDKDYRLQDKLPYELRDDGMLLVQVPGLGHGVGIGKENMPVILKTIKDKIDSWESTYKDPKYKAMIKEMKDLFETIGRKVEKEREIEVEKEVNGKKELVTENEKYFEWEYKEQNAKNGGMALEGLLQHMYLDEFMGKLYWQELLKNTGGDALAGAKVLRRVKLFANQSMRRQSEGQLDVAMAMYKNFLDIKGSEKGQYDSMKRLKKNKGMRIVIARDENFGAEGKQFSIVKEIQDQINKIKDTVSDKDREGLDNYLDLVKPDGDTPGALTYAGGKDISRVDSYMAVSPDMMTALYALNGAGHYTGLGGIKPIIHRVGSGIILGKTAFIVAPELASTKNKKGFFEKNGVDAVLFESGMKFGSSETKVLKDFDSMESFIKLDKNTVKEHIELLKLEDLSLGAIVSNEHAATLSYQVQNHLDKQQSKDLFTWLLQDKLDRFGKDQGHLFKAGNEVEALSMAKYWSEKNSSIDPKSLYSRWIASNGFPTSEIVKSDFINQMKSKRIDGGGLMKMKTEYGNQSVNAPGENLRFTYYTRDTQTGENTLYTYGQADLPAVAGGKLVSLDRLHLIDHRTGQRDQLVSAKDVKGQEVEIYNILKNVQMFENPRELSADGKPQDVWVVPNISTAKLQLAQIKKGKGKGKNFKTIKKQADGSYILEHKKGDNKYIYIQGSAAHKAVTPFITPDKTKVPGTVYTKTTQFKDRMTLREAKRVADDINTELGTNYEIAVAFRRNPQTRPGDIAIVGIRNILGNEYGNQVRLNAKDFAMRLEGDFDIDKTDYWWDTPNSILKKWSADSGKILRVNTDGANQKTSLNSQSVGGKDLPLNLLKPETVRAWDQNLAESERLRGVVIKTQRLLHAMSHYDSHSNSVFKTVTRGKKEQLDPITGFSLDLSGTKVGGMLYIDKAKLDRAYETLAKDIQNITDSLTGFDKTKYNAEWFDNFLFGDGVNYEGIFSKAVFDRSLGKKKGGVFIASDVPYTVQEKSVERAVIKKALAPYQAMLQLGTQKFAMGKSEAIKYDDILSVMQHFDSVMGNLNNHVYYSLKKNKNRGFSLDKLERFFATDDKGPTIDLFGSYGDNMRPNLFGTNKGKLSHEVFTGMLPFERTMANLAYLDRTTIRQPQMLKGEMLQKYQDFYSKFMYEENFDTIAKGLINELNSNDKMFGVVNWLDWRIKQQRNALYNAISNKKPWLIEHINESIDNMMEKKQQVEKTLISDERTDKFEYAKKMRDGAVASLINQVYKGKMLPKDWNKHAGSKNVALNKNQMKKGRGTDFDTTNDVHAFVKSNYNLFHNYIRNTKIVRLKGVSSNDQLELMIWHNMLEKYQNIGLKDKLTGQEVLDFEKDISDFKKFYRNTWKTHFSGSDWSMDSKRTNTVVQDYLANRFNYWQKHSGAGQLFLWKLMTPETDKFHYTYYNGRITPGFKNHSLSMIRLGMKFINNAEMGHFTDFQKSMIFNYMSDFYNSSYKAAMGQPGEAVTLFHRKLSNQANLRTEIFKGAPLIDDIRAWDPGKSVQESLLNPQLQHLFGNDPRSVVGTFNSAVVDPSIVGYATKLATWAYSPISYIPEHIGVTSYPQINGWQNYKKEIGNAANIMLGSSINQRLLFRKGPILEKASYEKVQPSEETGAESFNQKLDQKAKVFC